MRNDNEENSKSLLTLWSRGKMVRRPRPMVKYDMNRQILSLQTVVFSTVYRWSKMFPSGNTRKCNEKK